MGHAPLLLRDIQLGAVLAANKRLLGYIIIAGVGVLTFVLFHSFGRQKYLFARYRMYKSKRQVLARQKQIVH